MTDESRESGSPRQTRPLLQCSFLGLQKEDFVFEAKNGFVHACMEAYNQHHKLVIRPEDVWFAILTQLSAYVNAHAEEMRNGFVSHEGQADLFIEVDDLKDLDHGKMALEMTKLMQAAIKDEGMREWILPAFSTTTKIDQSVASIIFMGTMQKYFTYSWGTRCGLPSVTLLGEASDWVKLRQRAERLSTYGKEPARWLQVLAPVLDGFVSTFREPTSDKTLDFWRRICVEHLPNGSGTTTYSGWITAFCFWNEKGDCLHGPAPSALSRSSEVRLRRADIPTGFVKVPVNLIDAGTVIPHEMIAGSMGIKAARSAERTKEQDKNELRLIRNDRWLGLDQVQPQVGWFMYKT
jgi:hypothetical protein